MLNESTRNVSAGGAGTTAAAACKDLVKNGYKDSSVTALMAQFVRAGLAVRDNNHGYRVIVDEYIPMKASQKYTKKPKVHTKVKPTKVEKAERVEPKSDGIAALQPDAGEMPAPKRFVTLVRSKSPDDILKDMTVFQARELYDYLKKMFGG